MSVHGLISKVRDKAFAERSSRTRARQRSERGIYLERGESKAISLSGSSTRMATFGHNEGQALLAVWVGTRSAKQHRDWPLQRSPASFTCRFDSASARSGTATRQLRKREL